MRELLILRHAKSSWKHAGLSDDERPLNGRGERDAPRMGRWIADRGWVPDAVLSSDAVRARSTILLAMQAWDPAPPLTLLHELYLAGPSTYVERLRELGDGHLRAMVVGHNPGLEELASLLVGREVAMPTACLVRIGLPIDSWRALSLKTRGELLALQKPRELPDAE